MAKPIRVPLLYSQLELKAPEYCEASEYLLSTPGKQNSVKTHLALEVTAQKYFYQFTE